MTRRYVLWRLLQVVPTAAGIVLIGFLLIHLAPGDPVLALAGDHGNEEYYNFMRERFGLDQPLVEQIVTYSGRVLTGDLGTSYTQGRPVIDIIAERVPATLLLTVSALVLSTLVGIVLGLLAASRPGGVRDATVTTMSLGLYAAPVFLVGQLAILGFALGTGWFPVQGMTDARGGATGWAAWVDVAHHLALPALVLASQEVAAVARLSRAGLIDELGQDHIRTAWAKGLTARVVLVKHALRRALLPVVTVIGGRVGHLVAGTVVVEAVFGWPGIGGLLIDAMQSRDNPIVLGIFLLVAFCVVFANLVTDLVYTRLDPHIRFG